MSSDIQVLVLDGPPRKRGQIHGETLRSTIQEHIERWKDALGQDMDVAPDEYLEQFFQETNFLPAIKRWTPDLLEEVRGIAQGAGVDFKYVLIRQLSDEEPWYRVEKQARSGDEAVERIRAKLGENCSAIGVQAQGDKAPIVAQNMDTPAYYDGHQVLLHIKDPASPVEALIFTIAGKISLAGLNNQGVGICCNTLLQLDFSPSGLPEDFIVRGFLSRPTLDGAPSEWPSKRGGAPSEWPSKREGALAFMRGVKHASGQNYVVGGPERVLDLECSANKICEFVPYPGADRVYHTNHPLVNDDQELHRNRLTMMPPDIRQWYENRTTTHTRFESLEKRLSDPAETITIDKIKAALSSHKGPVCLDGETGSLMTLGCLIMELAPSPVLHLAPGPPCSTEFKTYTFGGG